MKAPAWQWPDFRGWVAMGYFALGWRVIEIIAAQPKLLDNSAFMLLVGSTVGAGGLGMVATFLFGSSKGTADANDRTDKVIAAVTKDA